VIWAKTDAGRARCRPRRSIKERAQRNLLLLIDGQKTEEMLLANVAGITRDDFTRCESMGLIEPVRGRRAAPRRPRRGGTGRSPAGAEAASRSTTRTSRRRSRSSSPRSSACAASR
jgi:hypothetical protein